MANFQSLKKLLHDDLQELESSGLEYANPEKFLEFKNGYLSISKEIAKYEEQYRDGVMPYSVIEVIRNEWNGLGSIIAMYMDGWGYKDITDYKNNKIKDVINSIMSRMNYDNYEKIEDELNTILTLYKDTLGDSVITEEIRELLERFNYQILKYKLRVNVIDDTDINRYISFILEDIKSILNDSEVSLNIKKELQKYFVDRELVRNNFKTVMILINLGITKKQVIDEELKDSLAETYYRAQDIVPEYHEPSIELMGDAQTVARDDLDKCYRCYHEYDVKETISATICYRISRFEVNTDDLVNLFVGQLVKKDFKDVKYLAEALIVHDYFYCLLIFRDSFYNQGKDYSYDIDCAVMAHCDKLSSDNLVKYILATDSKYLIDYVLRYKMISCFNSGFINNAIYTDNNDILNFVYKHSNSLLKEVLASDFDIEYKRMVINKYLNDETISDATKKEHLVNVYKSLLTKEDFSLKRIIIESLLTFNDAEAIIYFLRIVYLCFNKGNGALVHSERDIMLVLEVIPEGELKEKVLDFLYNLKNDVIDVLISTYFKNVVAAKKLH